MTIATDVETEELILKVADKLKGDLNAPEYILYVKSGAHKQRVPDQEDFWFRRCASVLWQLYNRSTVGVNRLRKHYGGGKRGSSVRPKRFVQAGGSAIRRAFQELEKKGYVKKAEKGRVLTGKGQKLLDNTASEMSKQAKQ